jgi:hypothetical protein
MSGSMTVFFRGENPLKADKLNTAFSERVLRTGDTMSGPLVLPANPVRQPEASNKEYVDEKTYNLQFALLSDLAGDDAGGSPGGGLIVDGTLTVNGDGSVTGNFTVVGNIVADGDMSSQKNITAGAAVIGQRIFAYDTTNPGLGGVIGSWDVGSLKGAGFRYNGNYAVPTMEFGAVDPSTGSMPSVVFTLSNAGDVGAAGSATIAKSLVVGQNTNLGGTLDVAGAVTMRTRLALDNSIGGEVFTVDAASGDVAMAGNAAIAGNVDMAQGLNVHASAQIGLNCVVGNDFATGGSVTVGRFLNVGDGMRLSGISPYPDNGAALAAGHQSGDLYFNSTVNALSVVLGA